MFTDFLTTSSLAAQISHLTSTVSIGESVYLGDILDIIIIAALIYIALFFLKQTRSILALIGIGIIVALYVVAQIFNLYLTSITLQSFFGVFFIILAIVFQDELRKFFEFLASIGTRQKQQRPVTTTSTVNKIVQAVVNLSRQKRGALIVITGKESIERYLDGGQLVDAIISENILESIFDPNSTGHDGAVTINKDRIVRFGAHLPLSKDFKQLKKVGTRHSAALGLAEKTDAFLIIVSEERGTISIAKNGKIKTLKDGEELTQKLNKFLQEKFPEEPVSIWENMLKKNTGIKAAALGISALIWFFAVFQSETIQRDFTLPVAYRNVPENVVIQETQPNEISVTLAGRGEAAFSRFDTSTLKITIDGSTLSDGINDIGISGDMIERPFSVSVINIEPEEIQTKVQVFETASMPVMVSTTGTLPENIELESISVSPKNITVLFPLHQEIPESVSTEDIDLSEINSGRTITTKLSLSDGARLRKDAKNEITVTINVRKVE